ncbi:hypothetical protein [Bacillus thuringiensis]|uniref:hypothetical protein n=1 Tax=Bacillus thuringiensis TaxID=1428 RepID=UPI000BFB440B|nr:hypothetical protein [Bacillus thuringiensis]PGT89836.1 hypothetical protein COD17_08795 [Bacillus thuringiensis]
MSDNIINVGLYGGKSIFGGREKPLEASVISCDMCNSCSYYKNNQCLSVREAFSSKCKYGTVSTAKGYTKRARKYYTFRDKWEKHESYGKLKAPPQKLGRIGDDVVFPYSHIHIEVKENGEIKLENPAMFSNPRYYIPMGMFTVELIYKLCKFRPQALMGGEIRSYREEEVPLFLAHLEEVLPELYRKFILTYPEYNTKIDYVGRKALLKTIEPSYVYYRSDNYPQFNEKWKWDGEFLVYTGGYVSKFKVASDYEIVEIKLRPTDKTVVEIESNDQVTGDTVFVD